MRIIPLILAALAVATWVTGCKQSNPADENTAAGDTNSLSVTQQWQNVKSDLTNTWQDVKQTTTQALAAVKTGTTQAWASVTESVQPTVDYTYDKKDAFVAKASADLDALDRQIKELSDKVATSSDSVKADAQTKLQDLRDKRAVLDKKLDAAKNATAADWNDVKTDFQNSYDDAKNSLKQAWQWLNDKLGS
jgi:flagellar motility protein MotE (MotC chaperone)